jgi:hypothetical protein
MNKNSVFAEEKGQFMKNAIQIISALFGVTLGANASAQYATRPLKVFILAGQSNMPLTTSSKRGRGKTDTSGTATKLEAVRTGWPISVRGATWSVLQKTNFKDTMSRFSTGHFLDGTTFLISTMLNQVLSEIAGGLH